MLHSSSVLAEQASSSTAALSSGFDVGLSGDFGGASEEISEM